MLLETETINSLRTKGHPEEAGAMQLLLDAYNGLIDEYNKLREEIENAT